MTPAAGPPAAGPPAAGPRCGYVGTLLAGMVALALAAQALADPVRAQVIDRTNYETVSALLPTSVLEWIKRGDLTLTLGQLSFEPRWEPAFLAASEANAGRYDVDADGGLIDAASRQRPAHTYGLPFPHIDPADAHAGLDIMWNVSFIFLKTGPLRGSFIFDWIGRNGFERTVRGVAATLPHDGQPAASVDPDHTEQRQLFRGVSPADVEGTASLTWRYMDDRPDTVWGYLPNLRRIRQMTAANRSDSFLGSDFSPDDALLWAGKNQSFQWKLAGHQDVLVSTVSLDLVRLLPGGSGPNGQEWDTPHECLDARLGWQTPHWSGAPWLPANAVWVRRPVWVVEGYPKDPYYRYGRQIFYVDTETFKTYYKVIYTPAGEYWKTLFNDFGMAATPGNDMRQVFAALLIGVDDRADHATYSGAGRDGIYEYNSARLSGDLFTVSGLVRLGK